MKKIICTFCIFFFVFLLFSQEMENSFYENGKGEKSPDKLYVMGTPFLIEDGKVTLLPPELSFTGEDIISFNLTTREIMFTDQVIKKIGNYKCFSFYFNTETLFENVYYRSCLVDAMTNNLTLKEKLGSYVDEFPTYEYFLYDGYPKSLDYEDPLLIIFHDSIKDWQKERDDNSEKRKEGWNIFIEYLRSEGKIIGYNPTKVESILKPQSNEISIYPNPTNGELRITNYETKFGVSPLGIDNVELFDIIGKKLSTVNYQQSNDKSIDISHLPAGIYFVRITTEKGVITKKIIKK